MEIKFNEQDIHNSICEYISYLVGISPFEVKSELNTEDFKEFSGIAKFNDQTRFIDHIELKNALIVKLAEMHNFIRENLIVSFFFEEGKGINALVQVTKPINLDK